MRTHHGEVTSFDDGLAYGEVTDNDGDVFFFHCTQIVDGSRTIQVGAHVEFTLVPGHIGRWEASEVMPLTSVRANEGNGALDASVPGEWFPCPVCGTRVDGLPSDYEICPECNWEDDPVQRADPSYAGGANTLALDEARLTWLANHAKRGSH